METTTPQAPKPQRRKRLLTGLRLTRRTAAIAVPFLMIAAPAGASIIVQNYMEADITAAPPCFLKLTGDDPVDSTQATFSADNTSDLIAIDGVDLLEEKISVTGMVGDRVIYTDVVRYVNNCVEDISVVLTSVEASGDWDEVSVELWLSNVEVPADTDPNIDVLADDWQNDYILVPAATPAGPVADSTGAVVVPGGGGEIRGAFVISSDVLFTGDIATLNWIAQATIVPAP